MTTYSSGRLLQSCLGIGRGTSGCQSAFEVCGAMGGDTAVGSPAHILQDIGKRVLSKLQQLDVTLSLKDLRVPPSNRMDALAGHRKGQLSIPNHVRYRPAAVPVFCPY